MGSVVDNKEDNYGPEKKDTTVHSSNVALDGVLVEIEPTNISSNEIIGSYVGKSAYAKNGSKIMIGKVVSYDWTKKVCSLIFENGDHEVMDLESVTKILLSNHQTVSYYKKRKLENIIHVATAEIKTPTTRSRKNNSLNNFEHSEDDNDSQPILKKSRKNNSNIMEQISLPGSSATEDANDTQLTFEKHPKVEYSGSEPTNIILVEEPLPDPSDIEEANGGEYADSDDDKNEDSVSDPYNIGQNKDTSSLPEVPVATLPPSSGDINIPDNSIPYLFAVYNLLRSFSVSLFLSPFGLDDFIECLNCMGKNTLLDTIHLSLMQALRRHLQSLPYENSSMASKCLRHVDWTLLDSSTWPTILVGYLYVMGHTKSLGEKLCCLGVCGGEYYGLPVGLKLEILQILCDDIMNSEEIKTKFRTRDDMSELEDFDMHSSKDYLDNGPRRVHPRNSKTSACKNIEMLENSSEFKMTDILNSNTSLQGANVLDDAEDGNSDECRRCGMDGMLICCDGCPSAYHSWCIGPSKQFLPNGPWYCPECSVNKLGTSSSRIGRGMSGAEIFGIDANQRMFVGTCNYLLVVGTQFNSELVATYYNRDDITKVLSALLTPESASAYVNICKGISTYLEVPLPSVGIPCENSGSTLCSLEDTIKLEVGDGCSSGVMNKPTSSDVLIEDYDLSNIIPCSISDKQCLNVISAKLGYASDLSKIKTESNSSHNKIFAACKEEGSSLNNVTKKETVCNPSTIDGKRHQADFRPQAYVNQYIQGDIATSAVANLAVLSSDESKVSESRNSSSNTNRKAVSANIALQMKAFSGATLNFVWPAFDKRLFDIPRERCGWCMACRAATTWKRECFLNSAASNANERFARNVNNGLSPVKQAENQVNLLVVGAHIAQMEEHLRGFLSGPLSDVHYNKQWHKLAWEASTCKILKNMLLDLEKSIQMIAFSGDWTKPVDDWLIEPSSSASGMLPAGSAIKNCGHGRKTHKKQSGLLEFEVNSLSAVLKNMFWRRGGKLSEGLFQKGTLPISHARKASRQGGIKRISGVQYPDGPDLPCRSHQFAWRAWVEMTKNVSQLALQVIYLDAHLRWNDFVRPEQSTDSKSSDVDTMPFRNAVICDKRTAENKTKYALVFNSVKHVPVWATKNILETEKLEDGSEKLWFLENNIPLYLIKEHEEKAGLKSTPFSEILKSQALVKLRKRKLEDWVEIISYLEHKGIEPSMPHCASCRQDVVLRDSVICNKCQGYFHKDCTKYSISIKEDHIQVLFVCKSCPARPAQNHKKTMRVPSKQRSVVGHQRPLLQEHSLLHNRPQKMSSRTPQNRQSACALVMKALAGSSVGCNNTKSSQYGLIWKRRNCDDTGSEFRMNNISLKGKYGANTSASMICNYCNKPYRPELMYIRCKTCPKWYHAEAVGLQESEIFNLIGFKCCRCRKKTQPRCPFTDPNYMEEAFNTIKSETSSDSANKLDHPTKIDTDNTIKTKKSVGTAKIDDFNLAGSSVGCTNTKSSQYGLIWKHKNCDETGAEFRTDNIFLKGKYGAKPSANMTCYYCNKPYRPELMYIRCETCPKWYHAEAVELQESEISNLIGFKCCSCRKKTLPLCPFADPNYMEEAINTIKSEKSPDSANKLDHPTKLNIKNTIKTEKSVDAAKIDDFALASSSVGCNNTKSSQYGLIWKHRNCDDTDAESRMNNIFPKGKYGSNPSANMTYYYCDKPYRPELRYIRCKTCSKWYHAEAVDLQESEISNLIGFKCCSCRKKALPRCPFADPIYMEEAINTIKSEKSPDSANKRDHPTKIDTENIIKIKKSVNAAKIDDFALAGSSVGCNNTKSSQYGLIWKRRNCDDTGTEFRMNNIFLKGKYGANPSASMTCNYCNIPYLPELMYIRCETCPKWYHAEAVHLQEYEISNLIGFKCCRCRKKAQPKCPFAYPNYMEEAINTVKSEKSPDFANKLDHPTKINTENAIKSEKSVDAAKIDDFPSAGSSVGCNNTKSSQYGLIWKHRNCDDTGAEFRMNNISLKGKYGANPSASMTCYYCNKPYRPELMYIRCETCPKWCHIEAVELQESEILNLIGFKCCSCCKKALPRCPFADQNYTEEAINTIKTEKSLDSANKFDHPTKIDTENTIKTEKSVDAAKIDDFAVIENDTLLHFHVKVEPLENHPFTDNSFTNTSTSSSRPQQKRAPCQM